MTEAEKPEHGSRRPSRGICLCLSGGGFRATLFHLGVIQRLNDLGILSRLSTITSVSGGSILNGLLASRWADLHLGPDGIYTNLRDVIAKPARAFCAVDLRTPLLLGTRLNPVNLPRLARDWFSVSANFLARYYEPLFGKALGEVPPPGPQTPRFIFCATNVRTGACWHFHAGSAARMGDFYTGYCGATQVRMAQAVAASSAFPPGFSALRMVVPTGDAFSREDPWGDQRVVSGKRAVDPATIGAEIRLTDGGVYDNLGVEPVWSAYDTLLASDAGRPFESQARCTQWVVSRLSRAAAISMEQVAAVRKRWLVADFVAKRRIGATWSLDTHLDDFALPDARGYSPVVRQLIQQMRTDLDAFSVGEIACLENHGYSLADAALRSRAPVLCAPDAHPFQWPHPDWVDETECARALARSGSRRLIRDAVRYLMSLFSLSRRS